jgi:hypothetical protein
VGKVYAEITPALAGWLKEQRIFFVATAPSAAGHVNVSPKGHDTFAIVDPRTVAYLDLTGSGIETVAHSRENGRIVFMFCAFDGPPRLVRLYGTGTVTPIGTTEFDGRAARFPSYPNARAVVTVALERIADSCGYGVPRYRYEGERSQLMDWADRKGPDGIAAYQAERNATSIDGLPGLTPRSPR